MSLLSTALFVVGALHLLVGVPARVGGFDAHGMRRSAQPTARLAPGFVRELVPARYAEVVGDRQAWRGFGAGVTGVGGSLLVVAWALAP